MQAEASNVALTADSSWYTFDVDDSVSPLYGLDWIDAQFATGYTGDNSVLHFTFSGAADLTVVDGGFAGDRFQVFDNGIALGLTSAATNTSTSVGTNFDLALGDSNYSSAVFHLGAGDHNITGLLASNTASFNITVGAVSLTAVPVPAALGLFLAGSSLIGLFSRRRANI
jgi:hypothetical protein